MGVVISFIKYLLWSCIEWVRWYVCGSVLGVFVGFDFYRESVIEKMKKGSRKLKVNTKEMKILIFGKNAPTKVCRGLNNVCTKSKWVL